MYQKAESMVTLRRLQVKWSKLRSPVDSIEFKQGLG